MAITVLDVAKARGVKRTNGKITLGDLEDVGLAMFGGCYNCYELISAYNAFPIKNGYWACRDCVGPHGYETTNEFEIQHKKWRRIIMDGKCRWCFIGLSVYQGPNGVWYHRRENPREHLIGIGYPIGFVNRVGAQWTEVNDDNDVCLSLNKDK